MRSLLRTPITPAEDFRAIASGTTPARCNGVEKSRDLRARAFRFAVDIVLRCRSQLVADPIMRRLAYQLLDAAGSVGVNLEESGAGQTKRDFIAKQCMALKEARESGLWLRVINAADPNVPNLRDYLQEANEIVKSNPHLGL